jgi:hypothetical protein
VGDDHAVAMGFKEVEPAFLLGGTRLVYFPLREVPSPPPQLSRAGPCDEWDICTCAELNCGFTLRRAGRSPGSCSERS